MSESKCLFIKGPTQDPVQYSAADMRALVAGAFGGTFESLSPGVGAIGRGHGVLTADAMVVTATPTPSHQVRVAPGMAVVRGTQAHKQGSYLCPLSSEVTVTIPPRDTVATTLHYVVAQVRDDEYATVTGNTWAVEVVAGTPGAGAPQVPEDSLVLARVSVPPGTGPTVVANSNITDLRPHARTTGGITPVSSPAAFPDPKQYDVIWDISSQSLRIRLGGSWVTIGRNFDAQWVPYKPSFHGVKIGNGSSYGRYMRIGRTVFGVCGFELGTTGNVPSGGGGPLATLPVDAYNPGANVRYMAAGRAWIGSSFYSCTAEIWPAFDPRLIFNFATAGRQWSPTEPDNWGTPGVGNGHLRVFFSYEAA